MKDVWEAARKLRADALGFTEEKQQEFIQEFLKCVENVAMSRAAKGDSAGFVYLKNGELDIMRECFCVLELKVAPFKISMMDNGRYVRVSW